MAARSILKAARAARGGGSPEKAELELARAVLEGKEARLDGQRVSASFVRAMCLRTDPKPSQVSIRGADITGEELDLDALRLEFPLKLRQCTLGTVSMQDTKLVTLDLGGTSCRGVRGDRARIDHGLLLNNGFEASDIVWLPSASVGDDVNCDGGSFHRPPDGQSEWALMLDGAQIGGRLFMRWGGGHRFTADGAVSVESARIGGAVLCRGAEITNSSGNALSLASADVRGRGWIRESELHGRANFLGASFGGRLDITDSKVHGAVDVARAVVRGEVNLGNTEVDGNVRLRAARVEGGVSFLGSKLDGGTVSLVRADIAGSLTWKRVRRSESKRLFVNLAQAQVRYLDDAPDAWLGARILLQGFSIDGIDLDAPRVNPAWGSLRHWGEEGNWLAGPRKTLGGKKGRVAGFLSKEDDSWVGKRRRWLAAQSPRRWSPHPYTQVSAALAKAGQDVAAREIRIERERRRGANQRMRGLSRLGHGLFGLVLGYGYRPLRALLWSAVVVAVGVAVLPGTASDYTAKTGAPPFERWLYSADAFIPVDLKQVASYTPREGVANILVGVETGLGWLLAALVVASVTGLLRKD